MAVFFKTREISNGKKKTVKKQQQSPAVCLYEHLCAAEDKLSFFPFLFLSFFKFMSMGSSAVSWPSVAKALISKKIKKNKNKNQYNIFTSPFVTLLLKDETQPKLADIIIIQYETSHNPFLVSSCTTCLNTTHTHTCIHKTLVMLFVHNKLELYLNIVF